MSGWTLLLVYLFAVTEVKVVFVEKLDWWCSEAGYTCSKLNSVVGRKGDFVQNRLMIISRVRVLGLNVPFILAQHFTPEIRIM